MSAVAERPQTGPCLECALEVDESRENNLGVFNRRTKSPDSIPYDHKHIQRLACKDSLGANLQSHLSLVKFGKHTDGNACLILISVDLSPRSTSGILRFREARIEVKIGSGRGQEFQNDTKRVTPQDYQGPRIMAWDPVSVQGPSQSTLQRFKISIDADVMPSVPIGPGIEYSISRERQKRRTIHGRIDDELARVLEWRIEENNSAGDGLPHVCKLAFVVRWDSDQEFHLRLKMRATTIAGLPVIAKDAAAVFFSPDRLHDSTFKDLAAKRNYTAAISGGSVAVGDNVFVSPESGSGLGPASSDIDLAQIDLSQLTNTKEMLQMQ